MPTVYLTDNAHRDIVLETAAHPAIETGGILLGHALGDDWYVVEVLDPGPRTVRSATYFEYNHTYATHLAAKVGRRYTTWPRLLGLWHRHPGSLDTFSRTDDTTHREYLRLLKGAFVSMLVNIDPDFRMTFYRVERGPRYTAMDIAIGDQHFPRELLERKSATDLAATLSRTDRASRLARLLSVPPPLPCQPTSEEMPIEWLPTVAPRTGPLPPLPPLPSVETPRTPGLVRQLVNGVQHLLTAWSEPRDVEEERITPYYRPYAGEPDDEPNPPRGASEEQVKLLDLIDPELDYLDEKREVFEYHISPQEPGFRMEVKVAMTPTRPPYPSRVEFAFYFRHGRAVVAIDGCEQPYQAGTLRRFYTAYDLPPLPASERPHDGPSTPCPCA